MIPSIEGLAVEGTTLVHGTVFGTPFLLLSESTFSENLEEKYRSDAQEIERIQRALQAVERQLLQLKTDFQRGGLQDESDIIAVQLAILQDETLVNELSVQIRQKKVSAERAIFLAKTNMRSLFSASPNRANRTFELLEDMFIRLHVELRSHASPMDASVRPKDQTILLAETLWPSRATELLQQGFSGIITKRGGKMSHAALLARSKGIPFITNISTEDWNRLTKAERLLLDGEGSLVYIDPSKELVEAVSCRVPKASSMSIAPKRTRQKASPISILASIECSGDVDGLQEADGVGLYRSEYLVQEVGYIPHEEEQVASFTHLVELTGKKPIYIRTFDFSGDKRWISCMSHGGSFQEQPRSLAEFLQNPALFFPHMRAIVRAALKGRVAVLFPMVSSVSDFRRCRAFTDAASLSVAGEKQKIAVGAMVELPSIICQLPELLEEADFISLGTNDLLQYCLAVNRLGSISCDRSLFLHEGFLSLLGYIAKVCKKAKKECIVCGEMPTDFGILMVLIGLGFTSFTLPLPLVQKTKKKLMQLDIKLAKKWADTLLLLPSREERFQWLETWKQTYG